MGCDKLWFIPTKLNDLQSNEGELWANFKSFLNLGALNCAQSSFLTMLSDAERNNLISALILSTPEKISP